MLKPRRRPGRRLDYDRVRSGLAYEAKRTRLLAWNGVEGVEGRREGEWCGVAWRGVAWNEEESREERG